MKCSYKFKVNGQLRATNLRPVNVRGFEFQFLSENEFITHLVVKVPANDSNDIPAVTHNPETKSKPHIHIPAPHFLLVQQEVRAIEVLLSVFGLHSIDLINFSTEWIPENDSDKMKLKINHFETSREKMMTSDLPVLPYDLLARSIIAAEDAIDIEVSLSFFRKGLIDMSEERYIEAFYDYYFFLESFFGEGKTRNRAVKEAFKKSEQLRNCIDLILKNQALNSMGSQENQRFLQHFKKKTIDDIIDHIVELRGYLHHHSANRKNGWHPDDHYRFKLDAMLLHRIGYRIATDTVLLRLFQEKTTAKYNEIIGLK